MTVLVPKFTVNNFERNSVIEVFNGLGELEMNPEYQRLGDTWPLKSKQLFIDSLLNGFDIPKIYFHRLPIKSQKSFAVIDGKQRLETIEKFVNGEFLLHSDFKFLNDPKKFKADGLSYQELGDVYPSLKAAFDQKKLSIIVIDSNDVRLVEDMFIRFNQDTSLNSAERRNALGGDVVRAIRTLGAHDFLQESVFFKNRRYSERELACRLLFITESFLQNEKLSGLTIKNLDNFTINNRTKRSLVARLLNFSSDTLTLMQRAFGNRHSLLKKGNIPVYFLFFCILRKIEKKSFDISVFEKFQATIDENREALNRGDFDIQNLTPSHSTFHNLSQQASGNPDFILDKVEILSEISGLEAQVFKFTKPMR